ncbi:MAG: T9SS type A sorting domain-containing protein [Saprospiraceae bacterium]|nr:T9SS type A sorting domain-containing protein [Saprospiraceae bacterium]HRG34443.1 T9SS type A sorting domain-containing protein [Saprospiraceae bacterium]
MAVKDFILFIAVCIFSHLAGVAQSDFCKKLNQPGLIFCDDFESTQAISSRYFEYNNNNGDFVPLGGLGRNSSTGMRVRWQPGEVGAGSLSKSFGRTPSTYIGKNASIPDSTFKEIYWRMDVRHQEGWLGGGPAKLSRALTLANGNWATGAMAHMWSGGQGDFYLGMDPATGIDASGKLVSTKYNDFANLRWLGFKAGNIPLYSSERVGEWFCIEGHVRLNTPGKSDGVFEFWINDTLQAGSYNLNWHGNWNADERNYGINAIFFENYWNAGSPVLQERYFDNLVIATSKISCKSATTHTKETTPLHCKVWQDPQHLNWPSDQNPNSTLKIYSLFGQLVLQPPVNISGKLNLAELQLPAGIYLYQLSGLSCGNSTGKLILHP